MQRGRTVFRRADLPSLLGRFCCLPRFNWVRRQFLPSAMQLVSIANLQLLEHPFISMDSNICCK